MTELRTAAQQALEALQGIYIAPEHGHYINEWWPDCRDAITALRAALAEDALQRLTDVSQEIEAAMVEPQEPVQEPVAWLSTDCIGERYLCFSKPLDNDQVQPLYTAPPQRKPLTEEEIQAAWNSVDMRHPRGNETRIAFARAVERAHGITS